MTPSTSGTVTLVFTDIENSTGLLETLGDRYVDLIADHHRIVDAAAARHGGTRIDAAGDGLFISFPSARGALAAVVEAQRELNANAWPEPAQVRVRVGIHTGEPISASTGYVGIDVHRAARICAAGHGGQILVSQAAASLLGSGLPDGTSLRDLGAHRLRGLGSPEQLYQVVTPGLDTDFPPVRTLDTLPNNLPRQMSSFVGRREEIAAAEERLRESTLVTLTGTGGVGKTRLAMEVGAHVVTSFPDGVWLIELASLTDGELVDDAVAATLRVKQRPNTEISAAVAEAIGERRMLLILDNCEHVMQPVIDLVAELVQRCPHLQVLATSREAMGIAGERLLPVASMPVPEVEAGVVGLAALTECDAVRLFVERARAVQPGFDLTERNAHAVAQICRRLDGIPLAVELAAARVRSLPPGQIAERLDSRFRLLTGGSRTALPRHRTLRAAMDWSYDLISEPRQAVLRRLSVFVGSFSLDAAEAVVSGDPVESDQVLDLLSDLVDRSLLLAEEGSMEARYRMLETIRDYAQERLAESGEAAEQHARHREWFTELVGRARSAFFSGPIQAEWVARLDADQDNLRAALRWAHEDPASADAELAMASGLWRFWEVRGDFEEGSAWLERALERVGGEVSLRRASALTGAGVLAADRGGYTQAVAYHEAALLLHRELGEPLAVATACNNVASVAVERGDYKRARELYIEAVELTRDGGDPRGAAYTLINLADMTARMGDEAEALRLFTQSIEMFEDLGDAWGIAHASTRLAVAARRRGDLETARRRFSDALTMHRRSGDRHGEARVLANLADVAADDGDPAGAEALYQGSLALRSELRDRMGVAIVLERLAGVAEDRPARAAALLGAASALRDDIGAPLSPGGVARVDQFLAGLKSAIGAPAVERALAEGRATPLPQTLARAAGRD